jgi:hypothetical protein
MRKLAGLSSRQRLFIGVVTLGLVLVVFGIIFLLIRSGTSSASDEQPIAFNHEAHAQNGIQCQFCHAGVRNSFSAGIPSVELCMGCHKAVATDSSEIQKLAGYWERQEAIPWHRVNDLPSFVHFNHSPHIAAGVSCGSCHGDVANMTTAEKVGDMSMGFCLDCHAEQENKDQLYDCAICHY